MRLSRSVFTAFIVFGLSCFATAIAPTRAYAYIVNVAEPIERIRLFEVPNVSGADVTTADINSNINEHSQYLQYMTKGTGTIESDGTIVGQSGNVTGMYSGSNYGVGSNLTGTITMSSSTSGRLTYNPPNYTASGSLSISSSNLRFNQNVESDNNYSETTALYGQEPIAGFTSTSNCCVGLYFGFDRAVVTAGQKLIPLLPRQLVQFVYNTTTGRSYVSTINNVEIWVGTNSTNLVKCEASGNYFIAPKNATIIVMTFSANNRTAANLANEHTYMLFWKPTIYVEYADQAIVDLQQQTIDNTESTNDTIEEQTQQQTQQLNDTTGSDSVTTDVVDDATEQFSTKLGFISQTADMTTQLFQALTYEGEGTVHFPGVRYENYQIIQEQDVPILGYLPTTIEDRFRDGVTLVLFLAWLHGIHNIYARIFLGQVEVTTEDE